MLVTIAALVCGLSANEPCTPWRYLIVAPEHVTEAECLDAATNLLNPPGAKQIVLVMGCTLHNGPYRKA